MVEKYSKFMRATGFRALLTVGAVFGCGLSQIYAGNGPSKPRDPRAEMTAIQYNIVKEVRQLRTDFTDNRKFVDLLLKAFDEYEKFIMEPGVQDWRPAVKAYHAAFEELKRCLQGEWRRIFGDGPSRFPWNGHSDGATDLWREDDLRRDIPVVLSFWDPSGDWGHVCRAKIPYNIGWPSAFCVPNDNKAYIPNNSQAYSNQGKIDSGKKRYKAYVLEFFNKSKLSKCKKYLEEFFCEPVSSILSGILCEESDFWKEQTWSKEDLQLLLNLYGDYYSLDAVAVDNRRGDDAMWGESGDYFLLPTCKMVQLMVCCYLSYEKQMPEVQKWLCSLLDNLDGNYYLEESLHMYGIQIHHLLMGYSHRTAMVGSTVVADKTFQCEGLLSGLEELGYNPLPKETWLKFVNYAGRRISLVRETESWGNLSKGLLMKPIGLNDTNTILHRSKTFDQVPCASLESMKAKK